MTEANSKQWERVKLSDVVSFKTGKLNSNAATPNGAYPFFTCSPETLRTDTYSFDTECVLLAGNNASGIYNIKYFRGKFDVYQRTYVIRSSDDKRLINRYLYYVLQTKVELLKSISTGAATKFLTLTILRDIDIELPPLPIQRKITAALSAYDDLIENNTRRIEILEQIAKTIYHEWFVKFCFPGHKKMKMVESELGPIPEGWTIEELTEVADVIDCLHSKKPLQAETGEEFGLLLHVWNIGANGKLDLSKEFYINESDYKFWIKRIEVNEGDCVITNVGRIGDFAQIPTGVKAAIGRNMTAVRCRKNLLTPTYLIEYLRSSYYEKQRGLKQDSGTIMGSLNVRGIVKLLVPLPPHDIMRQFEQMTRPIRHRIELLQYQSLNLHQTRDLLLPKLISGDLDVGDLDIDTEWLGYG